MSEGRRARVELGRDTLPQSKVTAFHFEKTDCEIGSTTMEVDALKLDIPIDKEHAANYWRERAECLEEWVCELLRKNQALRMNSEKEETIHRHRAGMTATISLRGVYQPFVPSGQPEFRTESPKISVDADPESCPSEECAEIRESVIQNAAIGLPRK